MDGWTDGQINRRTWGQSTDPSITFPLYHFPFISLFRIISYHFILLNLSQLGPAERSVARTNSTHSLAPFSYRVPRPLFSAFPISPFPCSSHILKGSNPTHPSALVDELLIRTSQNSAGITSPSTHAPSSPIHSLPSSLLPSSPHYPLT